MSELVRPADAEWEKFALQPTGQNRFGYSAGYFIRAGIVLSLC